MWAAVTSVRPVTVILQQIRPWPKFDRAVKLPAPSLFGGTGTRPVVIPRPPRDQVSRCFGHRPPTGFTMSAEWRRCFRITARFAVSMRTYGLATPGLVAWQITVLRADVAACALKPT